MSICISGSELSTICFNFLLLGRCLTHRVSGLACTPSTCWWLRWHMEFKKGMRIAAAPIWERKIVKFLKRRFEGKRRRKFWGFLFGRFAELVHTQSRGERIFFPPRSFRDTEPVAVTDAYSTSHQYSATWCSMCELPMLCPKCSERLFAAPSAVGANVTHKHSSSYAHRWLKKREKLINVLHMWICASASIALLTWWIWWFPIQSGHVLSTYMADLRAISSSWTWGFCNEIFLQLF